MKKILIINANSIDSQNATGITLKSLFSSIDKNYLFELYWNNSIDCSTIPNSHKLSFSCFSISRFLNRFRNSKINSEIKSESLNNNNYSFLHKLRLFVRQYFALYLDSHGIVLKKSIAKDVERFKPDIIYTLGGSVNSLKLSLILSKRFDIPIVLHHMDNWMHCIQWENNPLLLFYKKRLRKLCKMVYKRGSIHICISEKMSEDFAIETKREHVTIMNSISFDDYHINKPPKRETIELIYAGGMHLGRWKTLVTISNLIQKYNDSLNNKSKKMHLSIYSNVENLSMYGSYFCKIKCVSLLPSVDHSKILSIYESADALVHIESLENKQSDFFKYSISTKIPEYLATKRPFLFHGPSDIYLYSFLKLNNFAFVSSNDEEFLYNLNLLQDSKCYLNKTAFNDNYKHAVELFEKSGAIKKLISVFETTTLPKE